MQHKFDPTVETVEKPWLSSRTIRFALVLAGIGVAMLTSPAVKELIELIPVEYQGLATMIVSGLIIFFRAITKYPLEGRGRGK